MNSSQYQIYDVKFVSTNVTIAENSDYDVERIPYEKELEEYNTKVFENVELFKGSEYKPTKEEKERGYENIFNVKPPFSQELIQQFIEFTCGRLPQKEFPHIKYA